MVGLYIFGALVIAGFVVLIVFKIKWGREDKAVAHGRANKIEEERVERERTKK